MKRVLAASGMAAVFAAGAMAIPSPALAAGSVIDIGQTIYQSGYVKGSGSTTNTGDWDNVCLVIMARSFPAYGSPFSDKTKACKTAKGQWVWSAPDWKVPGGTCVEAYTRISAYKGGVRKSNKDSNKIVAGPGC
ncbi:hypothetical protein [Micromonospora marina]|uniref:hypothetical protein n=1 Tax=Micromonospora marina TaxID=307120 RepID=UPI003D70B2F7